MSRRFEGKNVVITGASGDIGRVVARAFAAEGARLGLVAGKNASAIADLGTTVTCDLLAPADRVRAGVEAARDELLKALGGVDALVLLAGLPATPALWNKSLDQVSAQDLHDAFAVDTVGTFLFAQAFAEALRKAHGAVVVTSSSAAFYGDVLGLAYAPAKSANAGLVKMLGDTEPRAQFFAAQSLGKLKDAKATAPLLALLRTRTLRATLLRRPEAGGVHRPSSTGCRGTRTADAPPDGGVPPKSSAPGT